MTSISLSLLYYDLQQELKKVSTTTIYIIYTNTSWFMPYTSCPTLKLHVLFMSLLCSDYKADML